jgi:hypothetical protein
MRNLRRDPFALDEVIAVIDVYKVLHGDELGRQKIREWAADKVFTEGAFQYVCRYIDGARDLST